MLARAVRQAINNQLRIDTVKGKQSIAMARNGVDAIKFLPGALNVKVKKFNQLQVKGGSNHDSLKVPKCFLIYLVMCINGLTRFSLSLSTLQGNHSQVNGLGKITGERRPC